MRRLDEEFHQVKNTVSSKFIAPSLEQKMSRDVLFGLMVSFYDYFCDSIDEDKLHPEERRVYAYKKAVALGAMSLSHLLHKRKEKNYKDLMKIFELLHPVVQQSPKFDYVIAMLNTVSALIVDGILPPGLTFPSILEWCSELYWSYQCSEPSRHYLEPFLFFFMYNFPTEERSGYDLCSVNDLTGAQKKWKEAFRNKYPLHEKEVIPHTRERTLFFLGKGGLGSDIVHQDSLPMKDDTLHSRMDKWHQPAMKARLRSFRGTLENGGEKITLYIEKGENGESGFPIEICTAYTVKNRRLWQTEVYFFLGFSFAGPKAYAITKDPPNVGEDNMQEAPNRQELPPSSEQATSSREQTAQKLSLGPLMSEKLKLEKVLRSKRSHLQDKKSTTPEIQSIERKLRQINDKVNLLLR